MGPPHKHPALNGGNRSERAKQVSSRRWTGPRIPLLVYNQSFEDPVPDLMGLQPRPGDNILTVASGGCNVLHLALSGADITAVDNNPAQIALTELKVVAAKHLTVEEFRLVFATGKAAPNTLRYLPLSNQTRRLIDTSRWFGRGGLYSHGLFGWAGRALRSWVRTTAAIRHIDAMFAAATMDEQIAHWTEARGRLWGPVGSRILSTSAPLLAFGVPSRVCRQMPESSWQVARGVDRVMTGTPADKNWFWQRLLLNEYRTARPPYLEADLSELGSVTLRHADLVHYLESAAFGSFDGASLLDTLHWLSPKARQRTWHALHRVLRPGGRVTFRRLHTSLLPPPRLFSRMPLEGMDRTGCYVDAVALVRR